MIQKLSIDGFRCFKSFEARHLSRINLLVGHNNSGKTSLLEAIHTLVRRGDPIALSSLMSRRGETLFVGLNRIGERQHELDIRRLFTGHALETGSYFLIYSEGDDAERTLRAKIKRVAAVTTHTTLPAPHVETTTDALWLVVESLFDHQNDSCRELRISSHGGIDPSTTGLQQTEREQIEPVSFISAETALQLETADAWGEVALTDGEALVEDCLRLIEPRLQRIAFVKDRTTEYGVFRVKLEEEPNPIPIGTMGAGTSRLLALAIALVQSRNGVLLVDEIDTGLHHSILGDVWKFVLEVAEKLNVQVFATTHSLDCIRGLAQVCNDSPTRGEDRISMHRLERGKPESVHYNERQIVIAAERGIETR